MKVGIICNHEVAIPTIQMLAYNNMLAYVAVHDINHELLATLMPMCKSMNIHLQLVTKKGYVNQLKSWLNTFKPDAVWMLTSSFIIPASLLRIPRYGFINFHYGLLPEFRGANPVFEQIRQKQKHGGITIHKVDEGIDTGAVILQQRVPITPTDTYAMHMNKLAMPGMELAKLLLQMMINGGEIPSFPQNEEQAGYYNRPTQEHVTIDWETMTAADIVALANACNPWNKGAAATIQSLVLGITSARVVDEIAQGELTKPGTILSIDANNGLRIATADGKVLQVDVLYTSDGFMPGHALKIYNIQKGTIFNITNKKAVEILNN